MNFAKENVHALDPMVIWDVTLYNLVHSCQHFRATCCLSHLLNIYRLALLYASEGLDVTSPLEV